MQAKPADAGQALLSEAPSPPKGELGLNLILNKESLQFGGFLISYKSFKSTQILVQTSWVRHPGSAYFAVAGFEDGVGEGFCFTSTIVSALPKGFFLPRSTNIGAATNTEE